MMHSFPRTASDLAGTADRVAQAAALCYRRGGDGVEVLLVTSRGTGRWVLPKGWIAEAGTPAETAAREAYEEAGVRGHADPQEIGCYTYDKALDDGRIMTCRVAVHALAVEKLLAAFPESGERRRRWFPAVQAAWQVHEPELRQLMLAFARQGVQDDPL